MVASLPECVERASVITDLEHFCVLCSSRQGQKNWIISKNHAGFNLKCLEAFKMSIIPAGQMCRGLRIAYTYCILIPLFHSHPNCSELRATFLAPKHFSDVWRWRQKMRLNLQNQQLPDNQMSDCPVGRLSPWCHRNARVCLNLKWRSNWRWFPPLNLSPLSTHAQPSAG